MFLPGPNIGVLIGFRPLYLSLPRPFVGLAILFLFIFIALMVVTALLVEDPVDGFLQQLPYQGLVVYVILTIDPLNYRRASRALVRARG